MNDYIRRFAKFIFYLALIFTVVLVIYPLVAGKESPIGWRDLIHNQRITTFLLFLLAYALAYPLITFSKIKRHLNGTFDDNREVFEKAFQTLDYVKTEDTPDKVVYRKKSKFTRFMQWYEDSVIIIPNENPVIISGMRKAVTRINGLIDHLLTKASE
jgi:hypothetical protein